jgi:hypothetical protein
MRESGERMADQGAVWADIDEKSRRMQAESETRAAAEMYERSRAELEAFVAGLEPVPRQAGALFTINGAVAGMDVFDSPSTWRKSMRKLVHSYGLDALDRAESAPRRSMANPTRFLSALKDAEQARFPAIGVGDDVRLTGRAVVGGGLVVGDKVVHLVAFPAPKRRTRVTEERVY